MSRVYGVTVWGLEFALCFGCWLKGSGFLWVFREFKAPGVLGVQAVAFRVQGGLGFRDLLGLMMVSLWMSSEP